MKWFAFLLLVWTSSFAAAADPIGAVTRIQGTADGSLGDGAHALAVGAPVHLGEIVTTGADARLELTFDDGTKLTLGERSRVVLDTFVYRPDGESTFHAAIAGPFRYVSGKLAPGATRQAAVTTPYASIGIRGTDFWGGPVDGRFGVFLIEGQVTVTAAGQDVTMGTPGQGVDVPAEGAPPGNIVVWGQPKIDRALQTVTFR